MIVFENQDLVVVDKPHGWLTIPARFKDDPRKVLGLELKRQLGMRLFPVHRLDYEVGGLVIFAKTALAHKTAQRWFELGQIQKTYSALSLGNHAVSEWVEWKSLLVRGKKRTFEAKHGSLAITKARVVNIKTILQWELMPITGRPHQLRFEMHKHGFAVLGDRLYGGQEWKGRPDNAIALKAIKLDLSQIQISERFDLPETVELPHLRY